MEDVDVQELMRKLLYGSRQEAFSTSFTPAECEVLLQQMRASYPRVRLGPRRSPTMDQVRKKKRKSAS